MWLKLHFVCLLSVATVDVVMAAISEFCDMAYSSESLFSSLSLPSMYFEHCSRVPTLSSHTFITNFTLFSMIMWRKSVIVLCFGALAAIMCYFLRHESIQLALI